MAGEEIKIGEDDREIVKPEEGIEELRAKLKAEEDRRIAAEGREQHLVGELNKTKGEVGQTNVQIVESAIERVKSERALIQQQYKDARAAGDLDAEGDAVTALSDNAATMRQLTTGLEAMKAAPPQVQQTTRTGDPVEDLARGMEKEGHQASADWVRKHPEYARDPDQYREMLAAHNLATGKRFGLRPNTPEYFAKVEEILGIDPATRHGEHTDQRANGHDDSATSGAAKPVQERDANKPPPAAPPSRGTGSGGYRLTAAEKEAAQISGITEEEYAANKLKKVN